MKESARAARFSIQGGGVLELINCYYSVRKYVTGTLKLKFDARCIVSLIHV